MTWRVTAWGPRPRGSRRHRLQLGELCHVRVDWSCGRALGEIVELDVERGAVRVYVEVQPPAGGARRTLCRRPEQVRTVDPGAIAAPALRLRLIAGTDLREAMIG